ncbi:MAG: hypothetical protein RL354_1118 [Planctomycetota bacterium]|jgi:hypothetical protein
MDLATYPRRVRSRFDAERDMLDEHRQACADAKLKAHWKKETHR